MTDLVLSVYKGLGVDQPFVLHLITAMTVSFLFSMAVVILGRFIDYLELAQMKLISKWVGFKWASFVCNRLTFPGIVLHELSHAFFIWVTGGEVTKVRLLAFGNDGKLGYVNFCTRGTKLQISCQMAFGSCAPVLVGMLAEYLLLLVIFTWELPLYSHIILWYMVISIFDHMSMSSVDMKNYLRGMLIVYPVMVTVVMAKLYFF